MKLCNDLAKPFGTGQLGRYCLALGAMVTLLALPLTASANMLNTYNVTGNTVTYIYGNYSPNSSLNLQFNPSSGGTGLVYLNISKPVGYNLTGQLGSGSATLQGQSLALGSKGLTGMLTPGQTYRLAYNFGGGGSKTVYKAAGVGGNFVSFRFVGHSGAPAPGAAVLALVGVGVLHAARRWIRK